MRSWLSAVVVVSLLTFVGGNRAKDAKEAKGERVTWKVVSLVADGREVPAEKISKAVIVVSGDKYTVTEEEKTVGRGTVKIDQTKKPMTIDRTSTFGPDKGKTYLGIVEITGDTMKVCFAQPGKKRPTEFTSTKGSGHILQTLQRVQKMK